MRPEVKRVTSKTCKEFIAQHVRANPGLVEAELGVSSEEAAAAGEARNWKRISKRLSESKEVWERWFDCVPFDDQLRARVRSSVVGDRVLSVEVWGE